MYYKVEADLSLKKKSIVCMVVGLIIAAIVVFLQLYNTGIIVLTTEQLIAVVSVLSGVLIAGIILSIAIPIFLSLHNRSAKIKGKMHSYEKNQTVDVYVNPDNKNVYYVDLDSVQ